MDVERRIKTKFEKLCQCGICLDLMNHPKTLNCQHTFCQKCLMLTCTENRMGLMSLFCPSCRQRQPLVFRPIDVLKLPSPFFVNQVIELLQEWSNRWKKTQTIAINCDNGAEVDKHDFVNTKITSVFKKINTETLEQMTQIRTDEFGLQSVKMKELKDEIQRSHQINSDLMIDNFIMKTRLDTKQNNNTTTVETVLNVNQKLNNYITNRDDNKSFSAQKIKNKFPKEDSALIPNTVYKNTKYNITKDIERIKRNDNSTTEDSTSKDQKHNSPLNSDFTVSKTLDKNKVTATGCSTKKGNSVFCWRCMRRGHIGNICKETTTLLGRKICECCNLVGHEGVNCHYY